VLLNVVEHRSGRVVSLGRLVLATVFLLAVWIDPSQPARYPREGYVILASYLVASAGYLAATWNNWWLEWRLAIWAHVVDITLFGVMVLLIDGYTSPFFTFFAFIILSAAIKWGWRETALTALAVILLFFLGGLVSLYRGESDLELARVLIRSTYLIVLSLVLIWFGINQHKASASQRQTPELTDPAFPGTLRLGRVAGYAAERTGAERVVIALSDKEEPWTDVATFEAGEADVRREPATGSGDLIAPALQHRPFIFELGECRELPSAGTRRSRRASESSIDTSFAERFGIRTGLAIPLDTETHSGCIFALEVPGLCADDIEIGEVIREQVSAALERAAVIGCLEAAAAARTRLSLARDVHDGVIQLLAGTVFRLKAIHNAAEAGRTVVDDVKSLEQELVVEQRELRAFIGQLRDSSVGSHATTACDELRGLLTRLGRQWQVDSRLVRCPEALSLSDTLRHAVQQLLREAIANAVRHGHASRVDVSVDIGEKGVSLIIADDGRGFDNADGDQSAAERPWSLNERVQELGGSLTLFSSSRGSRITVALPYKGRL
jgi:signal transduction histidine kinase